MAKGKLKELFKKKAGGSALGNALRLVGDKFTGGTYSSIFPKPTDADMDKDTKVVTSVNATPSYQDQENSQTKKELDLEIQAKNKKNLVIGLVVGGVVLVVGIIVKVLFFKKK